MLSVLLSSPRSRAIVADFTDSLRHQPPLVDVAQSVRNVCATTIVQNAWARKQSVSIHGWCYRIEGLPLSLRFSILAQTSTHRINVLRACTDGLIRDLNICISDQSQVHKIYTMVDEKIADIQSHSSRQHSAQDLLSAGEVEAHNQARRRSTIHEKPKDSSGNPRLSPTRSSSKSGLLRTYSISSSVMKRRSRSQPPAELAHNVSSDGEGASDPVPCPRPSSGKPVQGGKQSDQGLPPSPLIPQDGGKQRNKERSTSPSRTKLREPAARGQRNA